MNFVFPPNCFRIKGKSKKQSDCNETNKLVKTKVSPDTTRQSARVWLKMSTSAFAATIFWTNLILATKMRKPTRKARIVARAKILHPTIIFAVYEKKYEV